MSDVANVKVARRYAGALFGAAKKLELSQVVQADLIALADIWRRTPDLRRVLESPIIAASKKQDLVKRLFGSDISPLTTSFLNLLITKGREEILGTVNHEYQRLADDSNGLIRAQASVALPLDDVQREALIAGLKQRTGKNVELAIVVDPYVLGGVLVKMNDIVIDGSVRGALEKLRERMLR